MNKKKIIIGAVIGIILITVIGFVIFAIYGNAKETYSISFTHGNNQYDFKYNGTNTLKVIKYDVIQCIKAPCNPIKTGNYLTKITNDDKKVFEEILANNKDKKEINVSRNDLKESQYNTLLKIIGEEPVTTTTSTTEQQKPKYRERGYYVEKTDKDYRIIIAMGERSTTGNDISIVKAEMKDDAFYIYVKETIPQSGSVVDEAYSYPYAELGIKELPKSIIVINIDNNREYPRLN